MSKITMRHKFIAVEVPKKQEVEKGWKMPETSSNFGVVLFAPKEVNLKVGDKVFFKRSVHPMKMDGKDVLICLDEDIVAIKED